ncbi:hypothetical protein GP486_005474 [Trichoglossum hirsutum]|uniref:Uncharacterized protein n=1 Tax=Trichoglossum hirsutum TaxID=265104 RepID=A0A9P8RM69_9PEZI|nr:hypothetical protein GP486_005474 [Trichoglossum hirsutum]
MSQPPLYFGETLSSLFHSSASSSASTTARERARSEPAQHVKYQGQTHQRRLSLLKGTGFQGIALPARDINCRTPVGSPKAELRIDEDEQTTPRGAVRARRSVGEAGGNPLGILEEINNSVVRRRAASWADAHCNDQTSACSTSDGRNSPPSHYADFSKAASMRSRGGSLTPQTPSPIAKHTKRRQRRSPNFRSTFLESAQYIEHLESQLVALQTQLQALTSPTATKTQSAKLRALTTESRLLRQELSDWETRFDERVQEEVDGRVELEASLKARIRTLEREMDVKDEKIRELQWEVEVLEGKARAVGTMEAENISLGRRVDLLTELLAQSPTKLTTEPAVSISTDGRRNKLRPRSMFPRIISSESTCAVPLLVQDQEDSKRDSVQSASTTSTLPQSHWSDDYEDLLHHYPSKRNRISTDLESIFSSLSAASSLASTQPSVSRPTSILSDSSINPGAWELSVPLPPSRHKQDRLSRNRKMRRFPPGSSAPKSLILPTTSNVASLPASAPIDSPSELAYERTAAREPVSARLPSACNLPFGTTGHAHRNASAWAEKETLKVLEANSAYNRPNAANTRISESPSPSPQFTRYQGSEAGFGQGAPAQRESLFAEISRAEEGRLHSTPVVDTPQSASRSVEACVSPGGRICTAMDVKNQALTAKKPALLVGVARFGSFLWKLSAVLNEIWQDPVKLARKVISAGLSAGESKAPGELDWWLLGLLLRPIRRKGKEKSPGTENSLFDERRVGDEFNWRDITVEASKARRLSCLIARDDGDDLFGRGDSAGCGDAENDGRTSASLTVRAVSPTLLETVRYSNDPIEGPSQQKLMLWIEFTVALALAVGVAVKDGPASVLLGRATSDVGVMTDQQDAHEDSTMVGTTPSVEMGVRSRSTDYLESSYDL